MIPKSIRWRLLLWLTALLVAIVCGFGVTAFQLHRANRFSQIDAELVRRVAALSRDARPMPGPPPERGRFSPDAFDPHAKEPRAVGHKGPPPLPRGGDFTDRPAFGPDDDPDRENGPRGPERGYPEPPPVGSHGTNRIDFGPRSVRPAELDFISSSEPMNDFGPPFIPRPWMDEFGPGMRRVQLSTSTAGLFEEADPSGFYYVIWSRTGRELMRSTNAPVGIPFPQPSRTDTRIRTHTRAEFREAYQSTDIGECVLAGRSITADLAAIRRFAGWLVFAGFAVLGFGLGGSWMLATHAMQPIHEISAAATRISAGNLAERINVSDTDSELGRLAGILNSTFARLETAFAQQKQFTADAAHELRTPLAVLISEAQTTLARERNATEYREAIETCLDTAQQMRRLTQSLLELARLDSGQEQLKREAFDLAKHASACVDFITPLARERNIQIRRDLAPTQVHGDPDRLGQVVLNLLSNAVHYNKDHGEIRIATRKESSAAVLTISDTGQGIAASDLPHVFERFYRVDKSRARANGRNGLGLAICKAILESHGGSIEVNSTLGLGTTVTVRLPE